MPKTKPRTTNLAELAPLVQEMVRKELDRILAGLDAMSAQKSQRGPRVVKKTFSIPRDLWEEFEKRCPGVSSNHVTAALRMYLRLKGDSQQDE